MRPLTFIKPNEPFSHQLDGGLQFGLGFFETILIRERPLYLKQHLARLQKSLTAFNLGQAPSPSEVLALVCHHNLCQTALKLIVTEKNALATNRPLTYQRQDFERGRKLVVSSIVKSHQSPLVRHKSLAFAENILAARLAQKEGADDCLFLDEAGHLLEASTSNIFLIKENRLFTPPTQQAILPGVVRSELIMRLPVCQQPLSLEDLHETEAAFLTNSLMGVMPIYQIGEQRLNDQHPLIYQARHALGDWANLTNHASIEQ